MEELWLLISLIILFALIYKPLSRVILQALDGHAEKVRKELDEAKQLREEAQHLLAEHQRRLASGEQQARAIVEHAQAEVRRMTERHREELERSLRRRTELAEARIAQEEAKAVAALRAHTASLAVRTTERLLAREVEGDRAQSLIDDAITQIGRRLN
jgi:F-type H+-transporting ATPase subunit b